MDEIERTLDAYEATPESFIEKYLEASVAERFGDQFVDSLSGKRVLDVGCGPGRDVPPLTAAGLDVVGFDISPSLLGAGQRRVSDAEFVRGDMRRLPFPAGVFDGLWSCASFLHVPRPDAVPTLAEFRRVLDPDGIVFLSVKRRPFAGDGEQGRHFEYYEPAELRSLLAEADLDPRRLDGDDQWVWTVATPQ